jgi:hypothetical protein
MTFFIVTAVRTPNSGTMTSGITSLPDDYVVSSGRYFLSGGRTSLTSWWMQYVHTMPTNNVPTVPST